MPSLGERFRKSWNAFLGRDPTPKVEDTYIPRYGISYGGSSVRPDRHKLATANERTIVNSIFNRIAVDVSMLDIKHVVLDKKKERFDKVKDSHLNDLLTLNANEDQTGRAFIQDAVMSMFDEGVVALYPVETEGDPNVTDAFDIYTARTAQIKEWFPDRVLINVYNPFIGRRVDKFALKRYTPIIENPFYSIMNEPNSLAKRLIRVLSALDQVNEQTAAGKLDLIIQLPYPTRSPEKKKQAEYRRQELEEQLNGSRYGIAYTDVTEKVVQLNKSLENNLYNQAKDLEQQLMSQFGITPGILDGTAEDRERLNYENRTIEPIITALCENMKWKWLTKTAITQGQTIMYFKSPLKMVPMDQVAEMADKFTRNEIMSSNELRSVLGLMPSDDPKADQLVNANLNQSPEEMQLHGRNPSTSGEASSGIKLPNKIQNKKI